MQTIFPVIMPAFIMMQHYYDEMLALFERRHLPPPPHVNPAGQGNPQQQPHRQSLRQKRPLIGMGNGE